MSLRIFNSLTREVEPFVPIQAGHVRMYVCGMTVYDLCHIGHARMMVSFDVAVRWLKASGYQVTYVRNITDIDDKIIRRAVERGITIRALTEEMVQAMHQDIEALGIEPPTYEPRATDYIPQMLGMIARLHERGLAYPSPNGDVHYAVRQFAPYGRLSGKTLDALRAGERVAVDQDKHDPFDFVLWKAAKADEPADVKYESPYGWGRPGWHIECSAMSCALLGDHFDIHGGGLDLQFPHHENEIAQSEGATGQTMANYWMHNGFVNVDNEKMSKSLGNFFTIRDVLQHCDGETLRFFLIRTQYRSPFNFSDTLLDEARIALRRLYTALDAVAWDVLQAQSQSSITDWSHPAAAAFQAAMNEDLNVPQALAVLFELANELNRSHDMAVAVRLRQLGAVLGLLQKSPRAFLQQVVGAASSEALNAADIQARIDERIRAKQMKNFALADQIRADLLALGIALQDGPQGTTWSRVV